jgi:formate--tetrahydrofolate ligase
MNDRALRNVLVGLGETTSGKPRETGFDFTAASEIITILCLSKDLKDLKMRMGNIIIGYTFDKSPIFAKYLKAEGAMSALLKDVIKPNFAQTIEGKPVIIHGGPFANIAQGTNSVIATRMGMTFLEHTMTEAGFGFDFGDEKILAIKYQSTGLKPKAIVLTTTIRVLKYQGNAELKSLTAPDLVALKKGLPNLEKHLKNVLKFNISPKIVINRFTSDSDEEIEIIKQFNLSKNIKVALA